MSLLSYSSPTSGPVSVLVDLLPVFPLEITVYDSRDVTATVELVENGEADTVQVGPGRSGSALILRAVNRGHSVRDVLTSVLPGAVFSQTASVKGKSRAVQCGGDMWMGDGHGKATGAYLTIPRNSIIFLGNVGEITVRHDDRTMSIQRAAELDLLEVEQ